jgi:hypothetical protein
METKYLSLPTNDQKIYHQILAFLNPLLNLTTQERSILAEIIKLDNDYESLPIEKRYKFIFSREMREEMCDRLNIKKNHFGVVLNNLKQKTLFGQLIIDENNKIHPQLKIKPNQEGFKLVVEFKKQSIPQSSFFPPPLSSTQEESSESQQDQQQEEEFDISSFSLIDPNNE